MAAAAGDKTNIEIAIVETRRERRRKTRILPLPWHDAHLIDDVSAGSDPAPSTVSIPVMTVRII